MIKTLLIILIAITLSGCARVSVKTEGGAWDIKYAVLWRDIEEVEASVTDDGVQFSLGRASSELKPDNQMVACLLAPELCK